MNMHARTKYSEWRLSKKQKKLTIYVICILAIGLLIYNFSLPPSIRVANFDGQDTNYKGRESDFFDSTYDKPSGERKSDEKNEDKDHSASKIVNKFREDKKKEPSQPVEKFTQQKSDQLTEEGDPEVQDTSNRKKKQNKNKNSEKVQSAKAADSQAEYNVAADYDSILAKAPVVIFSKTYCPYSKKLKAILSEKFTFDPEPFIMELDTYEHGGELQKHVGTYTGRSTVPNLVINGDSYGGADDIVALDEQDELYDSLTKWLGKAGTVSLN